MPLVRHKIKRYRWVPDTLGQRDRPYAAPVVQLRKLPPEVDLHTLCPKVIYDQGQPDGYDDTQQRFIVRKSWGRSLGTRGYFTMSYAYLTGSNVTDDFWTIRIVSH